MCLGVHRKNLEYLLTPEANAEITGGLLPIQCIDLLDKNFTPPSFSFLPYFLTEFRNQGLTLSLSYLCPSPVTGVVTKL